MNDIQFKELIELHINKELNKVFENEPCYEHFKDSYVIQENKYNIPLIRLNTSGSSEESLIRKKLDSIVEKKNTNV